jgi:Family of unknown function (DUF6221)
MDRHRRRKQVEHCSVMQQDGSVNELAEFLLARVGEDETTARAVRGSGVHDARPMVKEWIGLANPQRMLVWSDARRRIVALHRSSLPSAAGGCGGCGRPTPCPTLRLMALPYADHPDYREEWRP